VEKTSARQPRVHQFPPENMFLAQTLSQVDGLRVGICGYISQTRKQLRVVIHDIIPIKCRISIALQIHYSPDIPMQERRHSENYLLAPITRSSEPHRPVRIDVHLHNRTRIIPKKESARSPLRRNPIARCIRRDSRAGKPALHLRDSSIQIIPTKGALSLKLQHGYHSSNATTSCDGNVDFRD
jgi:hypothetical protein